MRPLDGIRVLDLSRLLPGPWATRALAELGAEIIKVEDPVGGDYARWYPPLVGEPPTSGIFRALNGGKKSVALDLRTEDGRLALKRLAATADVLVDTFRPGVMTRLGLDPAGLLSDHPQLVYCAVTGFGLTGPERDAPGHDIGYLARTGALDLTGTPDAPQVLGVQVADLGGAMSAVAGILAALVARGRTGKGGVVDISLTESAMAFATTGFAQRSATGEDLRRGRELLDGSRPCYAVYATKDGRHLALGALEPKFWTSFVTALKLDHLATNGLDHGEAAHAVKEEVQAVLSTRTREEWVEFFADKHACVEPVLTLSEALEDRQAVARGSYRDGIPSSPVRVGGPELLVEPSPGPDLGPPPGLGEHTREILAAAGEDPDRLERILARVE